MVNAFTTLIKAWIPANGSNITFIAIHGNTLASPTAGEAKSKSSTAFISFWATTIMVSQTI